MHVTSVGSYGPVGSTAYTGYTYRLLLLLYIFLYARVYITREGCTLWLKLLLTKDTLQTVYVKNVEYLLENLSCHDSTVPYESQQPKNKAGMHFGGIHL